MPESAIGAGGVSVVPGSTQEVFPQWLGMYYATVSSSADPLRMGRCQLRIPQVLGTEVSPWAWALTTKTLAGPFYRHCCRVDQPPAVGTAVAVMFLGGDLSQPAYMLLTTSATTVTTPVVPGGGTSGGTTTGGTTTGGTGAGGTAGGGTAGGTTGALTVTTSSLPGAVVNQAYSATLAATGGTGSGYAWSLSVGSLPSWATLNASTGVIAGIPVATGTGSFNVKVTDSAGNVATQALSLTVAATGTGSTNPSWDASGSWTVVFSDDFTGSSLNSTYWGLGWQAETGTSGPINSAEGQDYTSANVSVSNSYLNLALTSSHGACVTTNTNGTGGSSGFEFSPPAAYEARIYLPPSPLAGDNGGVDNWPAFWSDGQNWPTTGEIDVVEGLNGYAAYHVHESSNPGGVGSNVGSVSAYAGWHTFGAYWTAGHVQFYYDGVSVGSLSTDSFTGPHYLIFDYTSSGPPDAGLTMLVDWVRVWTPG